LGAGVQDRREHREHQRAGETQPEPAVEDRHVDPLHALDEGEVARPRQPGHDRVPERREQPRHQAGGQRRRHQRRARPEAHCRLPPRAQRRHRDPHSVTANSVKSRGGRPSASATPPVVATFRPSSTTANTWPSPYATSDGYPASTAPATNSSTVTGRYRTGRPDAAEISAAAWPNVSARGPVTSYTWSSGSAPRSAATATSAMSPASTNGSGTSPAGSANSPASTASARKSSVKFCMKNADRTTAHSTPAAATAFSAASAPSSPRPDSSTSRRTPVAAASAASSPMASAAPGKARSGWYVRYAARTPASEPGQVARSVQSKGGSPAREPIRTGRSSARSRCATRRPVLPFPPRTRVRSVCVMAPVHPTGARRSIVYRRGNMC